MRDTHFTDAGVRNHPAADTDVVVDPDDVITTFERNATEEKRRNTHVLRLMPPFGDEVKAEPYLESGPKRYPPEQDPEPLHLSPGTFLENDDGPNPEETHLSYPTVAEARQLVAEEHGTPVKEAAVEARHEELLDEWESDVRNALLDRVRIFFHPATADEIWVDVRYESE